jgi:N-acetylglutamate synthase-like GNAT family acetyltransferase
VAPTYTQEGIETFLGMLTFEFLRETNPEKFTIVAEQEGQLVGISSIIKVCHIALLFVDSQFQGCGIGKRLIQSCISMRIERNPGLRALTVSSTANSVSFL